MGQSLVVLGGPRKFFLAVRGPLHGNLLDFLIVVEAVKFSYADPHETSCMKISHCL